MVHLTQPMPRGSQPMVHLTQPMPRGRTSFNYVISSRDTWQDLIGPHQHYYHLAACEWCTAMRRGARWQHIEKSPQLCMPHDSSLLVHLTTRGPHHTIKWLTSGSHQSATWQSAIWPYHHINTHQWVISSLIATCQALIQPLSPKPMTPHLYMTHGTVLLVSCQLTTRPIDVNPERLTD
jgi:hypothetical protein